MRALEKGPVADLTGEGDGALIGMGWATVDLERTASEVLELHFDDSGDESALGARALGTKVGSIELLLLEPSTEGRLAGWLARNGEGVAVIYVEGAGAADAPPVNTALGRPGRLEIPGDRTRPFLVVLDPG